jgi:hypothetical protein
MARNGPARARRKGRPRTNPLPRREQLRVSKRAQRTRERAAGWVLCQVRVRKATSERLRYALSLPGFEDTLAAFLAEQVIDTHEYPELKLLSWNRAERFIPAAEAFALYERNWRFVDPAALSQAERALIDRLVERFGNGALNA